MRPVQSIQDSFRRSPASGAQPLMFPCLWKSGPRSGPRCWRMELTQSVNISAVAGRTSRRPSRSRGAPRSRGAHQGTLSKMHLSPGPATRRQLSTSPHQTNFVCLSIFMCLLGGSCVHRDGRGVRIIRGRDGSFGQRPPGKSVDDS